jgi:hypothetical protein
VVWRSWVAILVVGAGCSRFVVDAPPRSPGVEPFECTDHSSAPTVDIALTVATAVVAVAAAGYVVSGPWDNTTDAIPTIHGVAFPFVLGGLVLAGAIPFGFYGSELYGSRAIASCRRAKLAAASARAVRDRQLHALELADVGARAAASGDCATALRIGDQIRSLDAPTFDDYAAEPHVAVCSR